MIFSAIAMLAALSAEPPRSAPPMQMASEQPPSLRPADPAYIGGHWTFPDWADISPGYPAEGS